jgi:hypothetical protein
MLKPEQLLLIDIETVPQFSSYEQLDERMQRLWDKKSQLIAPNEPDTISTFSERAGIYAEFGKIICIGLGYFVPIEHSFHLKVKSIFGHDEQEILKEFATVCNKFFKSPEKQFCGHNIREFDLPYICRRSFVQEVPLPAILSDLQMKKPWENPVYDTMQAWKFGEYKNFTSVDLLSAILGIDSPKDDIDGSDVAKVYWQENDINRIVTYCNKDIVTVAQIFLRLNGLPLIDDNHIEIQESAP